jgi:hypothetical protein
MENDDILNIVDSILSAYKKNQTFISKLKKFNFLSIINPYNPEEKIINPVAPNSNQDNKFGAVDSGFVNKQLNLANIIIIKEVGVVFEYNNNKLNKAIYFPKTYNLPKPYLNSSPMELEEIMWDTSILRLNKEINLGIDILKKEKINFLLLDGSIIPQYIAKPTKSSPLDQKYTELINKFVDIIEISKQKKCFIVGCIEDSRANRFFSFLKQEVLLNNDFDFELYDPFVVSSLLDLNQRTCVFKYSKDTDAHPILKDFPKDIRDNIYVCYVKLSNFDYPLRLEFVYFPEFGLSLLDFTNEIVNNIASISCFNKKYIYPAPLIEADLRSRLTLNDIDQIMTKILEKTKSLGIRLPRRENRIF